MHAHGQTQTHCGNFIAFLRFATHIVIQLACLIANSPRNGLFTFHLRAIEQDVNCGSFLCVGVDMVANHNVICHVSQIRIERLDETLSKRETESARKKRTKAF